MNDGGYPRVIALGDAAILVTLGDALTLSLNRRVHLLARRIRDAGLQAVIEVVPAYASLSVFYEPLHVDRDTIVAALEPLVAAVAGIHDEVPVDAREHRIAVTYDGEDLPEVARRTGLSAEEVTERHARRVYTVYMLGFVPGFAYLGELDPALELERRAEPRVRVPTGAVAIAGRQTAIYPRPTPGGWHIIGRTDAVLFDPSYGGAPALLAPGDRVRFEPVA